MFAGLWNLHQSVMAGVQHCLKYEVKGDASQITQTLELQARQPTKKRTLTTEVFAGIHRSGSAPSQAGKS
jgi:hypothetical protein